MKTSSKNEFFTWFLAGPIFVPARLVEQRLVDTYHDYNYPTDGFIWRAAVTKELERYGMRCVDPYSGEAMAWVKLYGESDGYRNLIESDEIDGIIAIVRPHNVEYIKEKNLKIALEVKGKPVVMWPTDLYATEKMRCKYCIVNSLEWVILRCSMIRDYVRELEKRKR